MKAYAIKHPQGYIIPATCALEESNSKRQFTGANREWQTYQDQGYRCVPIEIIEK